MIVDVQGVGDLFTDPQAPEMARRTRCRRARASPSPLLPVADSLARTLVRRGRPRRARHGVVLRDAREHRPVRTARAAAVLPRARAAGASCCCARPRRRSARRPHTGARRRRSPSRSRPHSRRDGARASRARGALHALHAAADEDPPTGTAARTRLRARAARRGRARRPPRSRPPPAARGTGHRAARGRHLSSPFWSRIAAALGGGRPFTCTWRRARRRRAQRRPAPAPRRRHARRRGARRAAPPT